MPRNLDRRVETVFPVEDPTLRTYLRHDVLEAYLRDTVMRAKLSRTALTCGSLPRPAKHRSIARAYFLGTELQMNR